MSKLVSQILEDINSIIDLEAQQPTGDELTLRINYIKQAVEEAASTGQFSEFDTVYEVGISSSITVSLPSNFREFKANPRLMDSSGNWNEYPEIEPGDKYQYTASDRYSYVLGNPSEGYNLILGGLITNATLSLQYQRYPSGIATTTDTVEFSDSMYIARKVESYILYSRSDDRFPIAQSLAEQRLSQMYAREAKSPGGQGRLTRSTFKNPLR